MYKTYFHKSFAVQIITFESLKVTLYNIVFENSSHLLGTEKMDEYMKI